MKNQIKIKSSGFIVSSAVIVFLSLLAWFKSSSPNGKKFSAVLFFSSASVGFVTRLKTDMDEREVNEDLAKIIETNNKVRDADDKLVKSIGDANYKLKLEVSGLTEQLGTSQNELEQIKKDYVAIQYALRQANEQIHLKSQELIDFEVNSNERFQGVLKEFIAKVVASLLGKVHQAYNSLDNNCIQLLKREEYSSIHEELSKFRQKLETDHAEHMVLVGDLENFNYTAINNLVDANVAAGEVMERYDQVSDELLALKAKFRNLKVIDERRALQEYEETEPYKTTKANAIKSLREQASFDESVIERLKVGLEANSDGLTELVRGIGTDLEKANERVAQLSAPITWKFALNHPTRAGNLIIEYCKANRVHLDRSHYSGDEYEASLYFFTDRLNAAQTVDIKALNDEGERLAQITYCLKPIKFTYEYDSRLLVAHLVLKHRETAKKQPSNPVEAAKQFIEPYDALPTFIKDAYHIGFWAATGGGKTTAISNTIGGMTQELGGSPKIRVTIPKIDSDTQAIFPDVHWLGISESIFGLLEAALEIQYRIHLNEKAFRAKEIIQDFEPILFFIDEINLIFTRWGEINDGDMEDVLARFESTLEGGRLAYFQNTMRIELTNYKNKFAKKLLLFIWQTGRSLRVKSLIAGQNLQPSSFGLKVNDLANCSYISMGASIKSCSKYKVREGDIDLVSKQYELLLEAQENERNLQYVALYCPSVGKSFFGILPPPNYYKWDDNLLNSRTPPATPPATSPKSSKTAASPAVHDGIRDIAQNVLQTAQKGSETAESHTAYDGIRDAAQNMIRNTPNFPPQRTEGKHFKFFEQRELLAKNYQNLDFRGYADLLANLPKKADGSVNKKKAYAEVFKVWKNDLKQVHSAFIDWLEVNFK